MVHQTKLEFLGSRRQYPWSIHSTSSSFLLSFSHNLLPLHVSLTSTHFLLSACSSSWVLFEIYFLLHATVVSLEPWSDSCVSKVFFMFLTLLTCFFLLEFTDNKKRWNIEWKLHPHQPHGYSGNILLQNIRSSEETLGILRGQGRFAL